MTKFKQALHFYFVQDAKLGERWLLVLGVLSAMAFRQYSEPVVQNTNSSIEEASFIPRTLTKNDSLLLIAEAQVGVPYQYAGKTPQGFDCSGFTRYVFNQLDVSLGASSYQQFREGVSVATEDALPGDLIFFRSSDKISHVGIITRREVQATYFIHASSSRGVVVDQLETEYFISRLAGIRRVISS